MSWKKAMIRLREAGAPFVSPDLDVALDSPDGSVTRKQFRGAMQDMFIDAPEITLSGAIRGYFSTYGGPDMIKAFLKKYPWSHREQSSKMRGERAPKSARE
jgi:hypothetical protein